jgi:hypothetical protein
MLTRGYLVENYSKTCEATLPLRHFRIICYTNKQELFWDKQMKWRIIGGKLALLALAAGFFYLLPLSSDKIPIWQPTTAENPGSGTVIANDEPGGSKPYSFNPHNQQSSVAAASTQPTIKKTREKTVVINNKEYPLRTYRPLMAPNDPLGSQWWVTNSTMNTAWDTPAGPRQTVLAIIDTGFALKHEEFQNRWYSNPNEVGGTALEGPSQLNCSDRGLAITASCNLIDEDNDGIIDNETGSATYQNPSRRNCTDQGKALDKSCNRIDDDGNGFIDDVTGWDFINNDNSVQAGELNPNGTGTTHGTIVTGLAAATGNNGKGIAGANWATKILPIQALDDDSYGDTLSVGRAIYYAAEQGADVISISLGSDLADDYVQEAIHAAIERGSVIVAASGNDGCNCIVYPAHYPEVVAVGALTTANQPANFSSWGDTLDILAPGTQMTSTSWRSDNGTSAYVSGANGTSFATPIVSGLMARLLSQQPSATPLQLIAALTENTNRLSLSPDTPHSATYGYGAIDAQKATNRMSIPVHNLIAYALLPISTGQYPGLTTSEIAGNYAVQACQNTIATTPIYELIKGTTRFFSISDTEVWKATHAGYNAQLFGQSCLQQPHDTADTIRDINVYAEFRNIYDKLNQ